MQVFIRLGLATEMKQEMGVNLFCSACQTDSQVYHQKKYNMQDCLKPDTFLLCMHTRIGVHLFFYMFAFMLISTHLLSLLQCFHVIPCDSKHKYTFPIYTKFLHSKTLSLKIHYFLLLVKHMSKFP